MTNQQAIIERLQAMRSNKEAILRGHLSEESHCTVQGIKDEAAALVAAYLSEIGHIECAMAFEKVGL